jgi:hypothetical protein
VTAFNSNGSFVADPSYTAGAGNYTTAGSWLAGIVPNGVNQTARFGGAGGAVNMNVATTLGALKFDSASSYTLSGSQITLQGGSPHIISSQGNHTVSAPVLLKQSAGLVANGGVLTINDLSVDGAATVPVEVYTGGTGVVAVNKVVGPALHVVSGTTRIISNGTSAATSKVNVLRFYGGATPQGKLDLTNNAFVVDYPAADAEPFDTIKGLIISGYAGGAWTGNGINSSTAAGGTTHGVGYAEASALTSIPAIFGTVDGSSVLMRYTRYGDTNLDGIINLGDFNRLAANFGVSGTANWDQGDFNYDNSVTLTDFNRLAANFGLSASPGGPTPEDWATLAAAIPEPSTLALAGLAATGLLRRRRRN